MKLLQDLVPGCTKVSLLAERTALLTFLKSELLLKNNDTFSLGRVGFGLI